MKMEVRGTLTDKNQGAYAYVGIDGCRGGWIAVELRVDGTWSANVFANIRQLWEAHRTAVLLLIDMPIGLANGPEGRRCDVLARQLLKPLRASSIFPAPVREVLSAGGYAEANALQRQRSGRGLSQQSWHLVPKIRELDELLQEDHAARKRFRESHPELCFAKLHGAPMPHGKKSAAGFGERVQLLRRLYGETDAVTEQLIGAYRRSVLARDDIADALVLAVTGLLSCGERMRELPEAGDADVTGLRSTISFFSAHVMDKYGNIY